MPIKISKKLKLPTDQFFPIENEKTGISLHHTVGGSAASTLDWWKRDDQMVGTAYLIDTDGTIYEVFEPKYWAWQFGLKWNREEKLPFEKRFIGIEIASEGGIIKRDGNFYCFDRVSNRTRKDKTKIFDYGKDYRGYRYFDKYESEQIDSVIQLINHLCTTFGIQKKLPNNYLEFFGKKLIDYEGIIGHTMVRLDKSDPAPYDVFWNRIIEECELEIVDIYLQTPEIKEMNSQEIKTLEENNKAECGKMNRAASSMVKQLMWDLQDEGRNTYIKLRNAEADGHVVFYDMVQGDSQLVKNLAKTIGFKSWDLNRLEVYNA